jgi:hypothetical protein
VGFKTAAKLLEIAANYYTYKIVNIFFGMDHGPSRPMSSSTSDYNWIALDSVSSRLIQGLCDNLSVVVHTHINNIARLQHYYKFASSSL